MEITISGKNMQVTDALKSLISEKLERATHRFNHITRINVVLHTEKAIHIADGTSHSPAGELHATAKTDDMYASVDEMIDKLTKQIIKQKDKMKDHHRAG